MWLTVLCSVIFRVLVGFTGLGCLDLMLVDVGYGCFGSGFGVLCCGVVVT